MSGNENTNKHLYNGLDFIHLVPDQWCVILRRKLVTNTSQATHRNETKNKFNLTDDLINYS